jgi:hypothetical protein
MTETETLHGDSRDVEEMTPDERIAVLQGVRAVFKHYKITCPKCQAMMMVTMGASILEAVGIFEEVPEGKPH